MMAESLHSPLGGSEAHRWTACPGSVNAQKDIPNLPNRYTQEGTDGHALAAALLRGEPASFPADLDDDVIEAVLEYVDVIRQDQIKFGGDIDIERTFELTDLHHLFRGTADCVRIGTCIGLYGGDSWKKMSVYDLKLGKGHVVEIGTQLKPNLQLVFYALGALSASRIGSLIKEIELVVVQPRAWHPDGPVRRIKFCVGDIEKFILRFKEAAARTSDPFAPRIPGDHCTFCRAAPHCPALRAYTYDIADFNGSGCGDSARLSPEGLGHVLAAAGIIEDWIRAVRDHAHHVAEIEGLPGWKLVDKRGTRKWINEDEAIKTLSTYVTDDQIYLRKIKSPAQIENLLNKDQKEQIEPLWHNVVSGTNLVRDTTPRPARKVIKFVNDTGALDYYW